jgi:glutamate-1-semialdehyde 2,1-aminomutase
MLERGVALAPGAYEVAFPSMAHQEAELDRTLEVAAEAIIDVVEA